MPRSPRETSPLIPEHVNLINSSGTHASSSGRIFEDYVRPVMSELIGTVMFVCLGVLCVQYASSDSTGMEPPPVASVTLCVAMGQGLVIAALIMALGDISGAHVNPALTVGVMLAGDIRPAKAALYIMAQLAGAVAGAGLSKAILPSRLYTAIGGGAHTLGVGVTPGEGLLCEVLLTAVLVLTVLVSAVDPVTKSPLAPVAIGFVVIVDILAGAQISGASMNPARSLGPAVVISTETSDFWKYHYVYWAGPCLGSLIAAVCYRLLLASEEKRLVFRS